ncbi:uncharacterized protein LOC113852192 [Abrus precatorius]|uniref:Uncharacterized protein LOC113852192 n=1 Tax=Abrus precatorius TaxID=3816 RepID=A0A8B8K558_ABRPR|nr:uncharacterized protein LOC113852192 [Abrus precatorius]
MALRWLLHSACHVFGYPMNNTEEQCKQIQIACYQNGEAKSLKGSSSNEVANEYPSSGFQMPLHYPRYTKPDYESMEEWKVNLLLMQYGLSFKGTLDEKRAFAMGTFLWPDQY